MATIQDQLVGKLIGLVPASGWWQLHPRQARLLFVAEINNEEINCWKAQLSVGKSIFKPHGFWIWSLESWFWSTYVFNFPVPFSMWTADMVGFWFLVIFNDTCLWISSTTWNNELLTCMYVSKNRQAQTRRIQEGRMR